jgi:hypothetical protein
MLKLLKVQDKEKFYSKQENSTKSQDLREAFSVEILQARRE